MIWKRQLLYIGIGFAVWFFFLFFDYRWLAPASIILYPLSILLLVLVLFFGKELFGARRWFSIGGVSIQPSEFSKLCVILAVSWVLSFRKADINRFLWAAGVLLLTALPFALIYKEPDLGSALVLLPAVGAIVFTAR